MKEPRYRGLRITKWKATRRPGFSADRMKILRDFAILNDIPAPRFIRVGVRQAIPDIVKEVVAHLKEIGFYAYTTDARDIWRMLDRARDYDYWRPYGHNRGKRT